MAGAELLQIDDDDIAGWVSDLRAVVERGTVDERRGLLRAWVKRVVADGDDLTIEYTFPLVSVAAPTGEAARPAQQALKRGREKPRGRDFSLP